MKFAILLYTLVALFYIWDAWREHKKSKKQIGEIDKLIDNLKKEMVNAEPVKHGRWIDEYDGKYANPRYICSNCKGKALYDFVRDELGNWMAVQVLTEQCPHCRVKLDEGVE